MRRVISVWLPGFATTTPPPAAASPRTAEDAGLTALARLAQACLCYAPITAMDPPDGLWIDITGAAHLFGGEELLLRDLQARLTAQGLDSRAAVADTPGAAWAMARFAGPSPSLATLPIEALRLSPDIAEGLRFMGLEQVGQVDTAPRAALAQRFGPLLALRLDQLFGRVFEPIRSQPVRGLPRARVDFSEPLLSRDALAEVVGHLAREVCVALTEAERGARRMDLRISWVDGSVQVLPLATARPNRDPRHLGRMLDERTQDVDPGAGITALHLLVRATEALGHTQVDGVLGDAPAPDLSLLVDRLVSRLGAGKVFRAQPVESDVPERSVRRGDPLDPPGNWPASPPPRPVRMLHPPLPLEPLAAPPDTPPAAFIWRRRELPVRHADGPERIPGEWWKTDAEMHAVRDYFQVEDEYGRRFWLYRRGDPTAGTGDGRWFLHSWF